MDQLFARSPSGLVPANKETGAWFEKLPVNTFVHGKLAKPRNLPFLRKYHCLMTYAFDAWSEWLAESRQAALYKGQAVMPDYDRFRKDITILCGYYTPIFCINGQTKLQAKSISFASMGEEEFEELYSKTIDVLLKHVAGMPQDKDEVRRIVDNLVSFA